MSVFADYVNAVADPAGYQANRRRESLQQQRDSYLDNLFNQLPEGIQGPPEPLDADQERIHQLLSAPPEMQGIRNMGIEQLGRRWFPQEQKQAALPSSVQEYQFAQSQGFPGSYQEWEASQRAPGASVNVNMPGRQQYGQIPDEQVRAMGLPEGVWWDSDSGPKKIAEYNDKQRQQAVTANTMLEIDKELSMFGPELSPESMRNNMEYVLPRVGGVDTDWIANYVKTPEGQQYQQLASEWTSMVLRAESGMEVPPAELQAAVQRFFPVPGDSASTIRAKSRRRRLKSQQMRRQAGRAYEELYPEEAQAEAAAGAPGESREVMINGKRVTITRNN